GIELLSVARRTGMTTPRPWMASGFGSSARRPPIPIMATASEENTTLVMADLRGRFPIVWKRACGHVVHRSRHCCATQATGASVPPQLTPECLLVLLQCRLGCCLYFLRIILEGRIEAVGAGLILLQGQLLAGPDADVLPFGLQGVEQGRGDAV